MTYLWAINLTQIRRKQIEHLEQTKEYKNIHNKFSLIFFIEMYLDLTSL